MRFMLFDVIKGMDEINSLYKRFELAASLGFDVIYHQRVGGIVTEEFADIIKNIHEYADNHGIPCDGAVIRYDDYAYGLSLGRTGHHYRYGIAKRKKMTLLKQYSVELNGIHLEMASLFRLVCLTRFPYWIQMYLVRHYII